MLRDRGYIEPYPNKSILEDLVMRSGRPTKDSFTPFDGLSSIINKQFQGSSRERFNLREFLDYSLSSDLDMVRINTEEQVVGLELTGGENAGYTRLEDMIDNQKDVVRYVEMQIVGYKKNRDSPYNQNYQITYTYVDDDEGEETDEKDIIHTEKDFDITAHSQIIKEIPYLLKIIHNASKNMKAHLFSFIRAYALILRNRNYTNNSQIVPRDFERYDLYRVKSDGTFDRRFIHKDDQKGIDYPAAREFILGRNKYDPAYIASMKLITYYELLEIDIEYEDPLKYNNDFIQSLICEYLPSNDEYIETFGRLDPEIYTALKPENLFNRSRKFELRDKDDLTLNESEVIYCIQDLIEMEVYLHPNLFDSWADKTDLVIEYLNKYFIIKYNKPSNFVAFNKNTFCESGTILKANGGWLKISGEYMGKYENDSNPTVILTTFGIAIVLTYKFTEMIYITIEDALVRLDKYKEGTNFDYGWNSL